ncbi:UNVERIFIED_CONTAM: hypothetical protein GTU68_009147 [Idotea baltica]|nr:hypothetical protein [Idotea baltica]
MKLDGKRELVINRQDSTEEDDPNSREKWGNQCEFFLSCLGFAVGFGNVWRFPFLCYKNGGAAFLIPYFIMLLLAGLPVFFMELALGQYVSLGPAVLFPELSPIFSGIGWAMLATSGMTCIYYNMVFAWSLFYTFASFTSVLPWGSCENDFNSEGCFTFQEANACMNMSMLYYNKSCHSTEDLCSISNMESFNETFCYDGQNTSSITLAEETISRISASEDYYQNRMLGVKGRSWESMGGFRWEIVGCYGLAWLIVCACMIKGVKSSGKVVYFTSLFPYVVLLILLIRGMTLEGAYEGIQFYILKPNMTKLMEVQVWNDAATQIFYSAGTAFGGLITLASYNKFQNNCMRDAIIISVANSATSIFSGFVIFSILGFMAAEINVPVSEVVDSGSGLAFIAYPAAVTQMPYPPLWSILFFTMLISLGLSSQFTYVETLSSGIFDHFGSLRSRKPLVMIGLCSGLFLLGLPLCLEGGVFMFELLNYYSGSLSVLFIAICEVFCIGYMYGFKKIFDERASRYEGLCSKSCSTATGELLGFS